MYLRLRTFHVSFIVKVGHLPSVLLVVVVVSVRGVVRGRDGLGVRSGRAVVEVDLRASRVGAGHRRYHHLLGLAAVRRAHADHPDEQHNDDYEDDCAGDAASNVGEVGLGGAVATGEAADAATRRLTLVVLDAHALVLAVASAQV